MKDRKVIQASYDNPEYVHLVEQGLRLTGRFNAVKHSVDVFGCLWFVDEEGNEIMFEAFHG